MTFAYVRRSYRGDGAGFAWPKELGGGISVVKDVFGARPFLPHVPTTGYDYDFHRGIDVSMTGGDPIRSPMTGAIIRSNYSMFGFEDSLQYDELSLSDPVGSLTVSEGTEEAVLSLARVGVAAFPVDIDWWEMTRVRVDPEDDDWALEFELTSSPSIASGALGLGLFNSARTQYVGMEYDGATITLRGVGSGAFASNGATFPVVGAKWLRVYYTLSTDSISWAHSTDGNTWTVLATNAAIAFTYQGMSFIPCIYWRSGDVNASPFTVNVKQFNLSDTGQSIGRFGNWVTIANASEKFLIMHMRTLYKRQGDFVSVGSVLGLAGNTGFDERSGRVLYEHGHLEYAQNNRAIYSNDEALNPLGDGVLPKTDTTSNVSVVRTSENDPDGILSHKLAITVDRDDQDFDLNTVTLVGSLATRTVNWNTRAGLNADNDIPVWDGVYIVPENFTEVSPSYQCAFFFNQATVGTFVSYAVYDTAGNLLASG